MNHDPGSRLSTLLLAGLAACTPSFALDLTVEISGAATQQGQLSVVIFDSAAKWLKDGQALHDARAPAATDVHVTFRGVAAGRYALTTFHDENVNGKLDANFLGASREAYGFSRDVRHRTRSADFDEAAIDLSADRTISLRLK